MSQAHCSRPLDTTVNKKTKIQSRQKHHSAKEPRKEKNPDQAQKIMKKKYLLLVHLSVSSSHFPIATCKQTRLLVIPVMKHRNFKFLRKKLFAPNVNTWLFDKIAQNYILIKKGLFVCQYHSQIYYCYYQNKTTCYFLKLEYIMHYRIQNCYPQRMFWGKLSYK